MAEPWNDSVALALVDRAREVRHATAVDTAFRSYQADARGFVYFFLDRPDSDERTLVKADQVALEVYWRAPNSTKQRIVGLRDEKVLPTNIRYHLDHLTIVQDEFGDRIRLGDGDEVSDVLHPLAHDAEDVYDHRLTDSLTIAFPGLDREAVRVYEIQVRPRDMDRPGFIGSVFIDRTSAAVVRMSFTFTPASYVDPYLDYIRISLDNSLWMGKYWLPYRQEAELRRELPQLDFLAGSVIRGRFEIDEYRFNEELPDGLFRTSGVSALPERIRESFPFEEPLFAQLEDEGLSTPPALEEIRERTREMVADRYLSGLARLRLHLPSASSAYRFGRAEGHFLGGGATFRPVGGLKLEGHVGWAFGRGEPSGSLAASGSRLGGARVEAYGNRLRDMGPIPAASGVVNTLGGLLADEDWVDPFFATGARVSGRAAGPGEVALLSALLGPGVPDAAFVLEHHTSADLVVDAGDFRLVRPIQEGTLGALTLGVGFGGGAEPSDGVGLHLGTRLAVFEGARFSEATGSLAWARADTWRHLDVTLRFDGRVAGGALPPQALYLLGGRGTLLGHAFRGAVGDQFWLARADATRRVLDSWLSLRAFAAAGEARMKPSEVPALWTDVDPAAGPLVSVGAGLGLLWDVIRIDWGYGLDGGGWEAAFSVARRFHGWL